MLYRFAKAQGMDTTQGGMAAREFADFESVSSYALEAMDWAVNTGVLKGDNNRLLPQDNCTRAQIVTMLYRAGRIITATRTVWNVMQLSISATAHTASSKSSWVVHKPSKKESLR